MVNPYQLECTLKICINLTPMLDPEDSVNSLMRQYYNGGSGVLFIQVIFLYWSLTLTSKNSP